MAKDSAPKESKPTGFYRNPNGSDRPVNAGPVKADGTVDLADSETAETLVTDCPVSKEPAVGSYTPSS